MREGSYDAGQANTHTKEKHTHRGKGRTRSRSMAKVDKSSYATISVQAYYEGAS